MNVVGAVLTRMIWFGLWVAQPLRKPAETHCEIPTPRDYEWVDTHYCEVHRGWAKHLFIEWMPERVTTAKCFACGFEGTVA